MHAAVFAAAIALSSLSTTHLPQQPGIQREGFWIAGGAAITSVGFGGDAADFDVGRESGLAVHGGAGYTVSPHVAVGGELDLWSKESDGNTATIWGASAVAYFFPSARRGWWLKAGVGVLVLDESDIGNRGSGVAIKLGAGHDFRLREHLFLAPYFQAIFSSGVEIAQEGSDTGFTENPNLIQGGVTLTWR